MGKSARGDSSELLEELVWGILMLVPVKSLMRFKCVCKLWLSIIQNPLFANSYQGCFKGLLITKPCDPHEWLEEPYNHPFSYLNLPEVDNGNVPISIPFSYSMSLGGKMACTDPVNGLICFFYGNFSCLYNLATRESMVLPVSVRKSKALYVSVWDESFCVYHLGFDPSSKLYKLLKHCLAYKDSSDDSYDEEIECSYLCSEILTVGVDSSWRSIDPPPCGITPGGICTNGFIYWCDRSYKPPVNDRDHLLCFDLCQEEFQRGPLPENGLKMLSFGPCLAFASRPRVQHKDLPGGDPVMSLYFYNNGQASPDGSWIKHEIMLPKPTGPYVFYCFKAVCSLPDRKVLIGCQFWDNTYKTIYHVYDQGTRMLRKCFTSDCHISGIFGGIVAANFRLYEDLDDDDDPERYLLMSYHEENIMPLRCLGSNF